MFNFIEEMLCAIILLSAITVLIGFILVIIFAVLIVPCILGILNYFIAEPKPVDRCALAA